MSKIRSIRSALKQKKRNPKTFKWLQDWKNDIVYPYPTDSGTHICVPDSSCCTGVLLPKNVRQQYFKIYCTGDYQAIGEATEEMARYVYNNYLS